MLGLSINLLLTRSLSAAEFRNEIQLKGWSQENLAARWQITPGYLSKIINNPKRPPHWNDAVTALPVLTASQARSVAKDRKSLLPRKLPARPEATTKGSTLEKCEDSRGFRYAGYLVVGSVLVTDNFGDYPDGTECQVIQVNQTATVEQYKILFPHDEQFWVTPDEIDAHLLYCGR